MAAGALPPATIVLTGGSGSVATAIRPLLAREGRSITLVDIVDPGPLAPQERFIASSVTDKDALIDALAGADLIVHLGGISKEGPWEELLHANIDGTRVLLEAAYAVGCMRVLLASSHHVAGFTPFDELTSGQPLPRPDSYYGVSKAAMEALGSMFADRFGMTIVSARIGAFGSIPTVGRGQSLWLSPADAVRLINATLTKAPPGHNIVWAVSANGSHRIPLDGASIGYEPRDNALAVPLGPANSAGEPNESTLLGGFATAANQHPGQPW